MSKKIAVYFKKKEGGKDPFANWGRKRAAYHALFRAGCAKGFEMYFIPRPEHYIGSLQFRNPYRYDPVAGSFSLIAEEIAMDAVYDRSGGLEFPTQDISSKTLNSRAFKELCADKNATYEIIGDHMPDTFRIRNNDDFHAAIKQFHPDETTVFKPIDGFGGKGIVICPAKELHPEELIEPKKEYCLQKFVDTSSGILGITDDRHDLRIIIIDGEIILAHVRSPKKGAFLANVAQGGSIREVPLENIPENILVVVRRIQDLLDTRYDKPIYSIDIGVEREHPYVFELNDQIGFPSEDMRYNGFIEKIIASLAKRAHRQPTEKTSKENPLYPRKELTKIL